MKLPTLLMLGFMIHGTIAQAQTILEGKDAQDYLIQNADEKNRKVLVNRQLAQLCFSDTHKCHPVLVGKTTPKGKFVMTLVPTDLAGYGGDVMAFKWEKDFTFALHRLWTLKPQENRPKRIQSPNPADRIMTNGCINVADNVYEQLKQYHVVEIF